MRNIIPDKMRRLLVFALMCCLLGVVVSPVYAAGDDISGHWAVDDIRFLIDEGIVLGDDKGNINPNNNITRAEFVAIINRAMDYTEKAGSNFPDVRSGAWYSDQFAIAKSAGYLVGDDNGNANPDKAITRAEVVVILDRILELPGTTATSAFSDSGSFPAWSVQAIINLTTSELVKGYPDNTFRAGRNITRAEAFTILARIIRFDLSDEFVVTVTAGSLDDMYAYQFRLVFDSNKLRFKGPVSKINGMSAFYNTLEGYEFVGGTMTGSSKGISGVDVVVCELQFAARKGFTPDDVGITLSNIGVVTSKASDIEEVTGWTLAIILKE